MVYKLNKFDKPVKTFVDDVKKYDVAKIEYVDFDNFIDIVILDIKIEQFANNRSRCLRIEFETPYGDKDVCYSYIYSKDDYYLDIIGRAEKIQDNKNDLQM